jgi:hypothetical protein
MLFGLAWSVPETIVGRIGFGAVIAGDSLIGNRQEQHLGFGIGHDLPDFAVTNRFHTYSFRLASKYPSGTPLSGTITRFVRGSMFSFRCRQSRANASRH